MSDYLNGLSNGDANKMNGYDQFIQDQEGAENSRLVNGNYAGDDLDAQGVSIAGVHKKKSVLDDLPENRGERAQVLLKNLPSEDLVHIVPEKIPAILRIDKDVQNKRELLYDFYRQYQEFNIEFLEKDVKKRLVQQIDKCSEDYAEHGRQVENLLTQGEKTNQNSLSLQNETVRMRINQNQNISDVMKESAAQMNKFENQNNEKQDLRDRLQDMKNKLRDMQVSIEQESIKNENLKNVKSIETDLRKVRDQQEIELLKISADTQKATAEYSYEVLAEIQAQDDDVRKESNDLKQNMSKRQSVNVQELLQLIESDMNKNKQMISSLDMQVKDTDNNCSQFKSTNKVLQSNMNQLEQTLAQAQRDELNVSTEFDQNLSQMEQKVRLQNQKVQESVQGLAQTQKEFKKLKNKTETLKSKLDISQSISSYYESCNYKVKLSNLQSEIQRSTDKGDKLENEIESQEKRWNDMYDQTVDDLKYKIQESNSQRSLQQIQVLVDSIKDKEDQIGQLQVEIQQIQNDQQDQIEDAELQKLKETVQEKVTQFKLLLNDKSAMYEEMHSKAFLMINRDQQIVENQEEIIQLKHEIDINILEIEQKSAIIFELQEKLKDRKAQYKALKQDIKELEEQCDELTMILKQKVNELETLEDVLRDKDVVIEGLEKTLGEKAPQLTDADRALKKPSDRYRAISGDIVDELLAKYINSMEISVPIRRLGDGFYLFGTRRIYAKVLNNKLVVRVGGGYMSFTEFIDTYALAELKKINELQATGDWDLEKFVQGQMDQDSPNKGPRKQNMVGRSSVSPMRVQGRASPVNKNLQGRSSPTYGR